ncbi:MAG: glycoside hydrolase family 36 protein [Caldisericaceae bacterium]
MKKFDYKLVKLGTRLQDRSIDAESASIGSATLQVHFNEDLSLTLEAKESIYIDEVYFDLAFESCNKIVMFRNGFQSWSPSYQIQPHTKFERCLMPVLRYDYLDPKNFSETRSHFFTYLKDGDDYLLLVPDDNSLKVSFEMIDQKTLRIYFEIGKQIDGDFSTQKIETKHTKSLTFDKKTHKKIYGWTSWYYYYRNVNPEELLRNIENIDKLPFALDFFQIDDGWQRSVGDWVENEKFKGQLKMIAETLNKKGVTPGIWLAPFVAERNSDIFRKHKDWLIKDESDNPQPIGFNPTWSGYFYALDPMNNSVLDYLADKITFLRQIGFKMFKFDFLYSLMVTHKNKKEDITRIERFNRGMNTLKSAIGKGSTLLGCGAPVILEKGLYDYLRIGPDTKDGWEDTLTRMIRFQGRVSAKNSLRNTITRSFINEKYFVNDPDVVFLKPKKLTEDEKNTILVTNYFLSDFIFFSDPIYQLEKKNFELLLQLKNYQNFKLQSIEELKKDVFKFSGSVDDSTIKGLVNLTDEKYIPTELNREIILGKTGQSVLPHATQVYKTRE